MDGLIFGGGGGGGGGGGATNRLGCRAYLATQATGVNTTGGYTIGYDAEEFDFGGWHDNVTNNSRLTVPSGVDFVNVTFGGVVNNLGSGGMRFELLLNGTSISMDYAPLYGVAAGCLSAFGDIAVVPGDYFQVSAKAETDTSVDLLAIQYRQFLQVTQTFLGA